VTEATASSSASSSVLLATLLSFAGSAIHQ
jgi:hypothetical protein